MNFPLILCKILNRLGVLSYFNITVDLKFHFKKFKIPILGRVGFEHLYLVEDYDFMVYKYFKEKITKGCFIDVGANIGQTILKINSLTSGKIVSIEPNATCVAYLEELKSINKINLTIVPVALFDHMGIRKLYLLDKRDTGASLIRDDRPDYFGQDQFLLVNSITGTSLQDIIEERISFIKIDVEGAELMVLESLRVLIEGNRPIIYCEILDAHTSAVQESSNSNKSRIFSLLKEIDYFRFDRILNSLIPIDGFPSRTYRAENLNECNYIFLPQ